MTRLNEPRDFAQWGAQVRGIKGGAVKLVGSKSSQCVITVATGYSPDVLKPLILSLREHSKAHLIIATDKADKVGSAFAGQDVTVYRVEKAAGYQPYPALARLAYYLDIIRGLPAHVKQLLLVDSRDVIFQACPFEQLTGNALTFFAENNDTKSWTLTTTNGRWAWAMLQSEYRAALKGKPIVNGGVIAGTPGAVEAMCLAKLDIALKTAEWTKHTTGLDNISTNVIAHMELAGECKVMANNRVVANIYRDTVASIDEASGHIVTYGAPVCPIVHMYDRKPELLRHVNNRYNVATQNQMMVAQDRSIGPKQTLAGLRHWLKIGRIAMTGRP